MIKRNQLSMILLNNVTTNTNHFSDSVHPVSAHKLTANTSGKDVSFIIVLTAVQLDLRAVNTINWNRNFLCKEDSLPVLTSKLFSSWSWHVQSMVWWAIDI